MGSAFSGGKDKVEPASPEKEGSATADSEETPFVKSRRCTDAACMIVFIVFFIPLIGLLIYCIRYGNIYRILNGYDRCGNVCGRVTERVGIAPNDPKFTCFGADMTKYKFLMVRGAGIRDSEQQEANVNRECVSSCAGYPGYREFFNRCIPEKTQDQVNVFFSKTGLSNFFQEVSEDMDLCWKEILALFFIALGFSLVLLILLRVAVALVVWVMLGTVLIVCFIATAYLWVQWANKRDKLKEDYRYLPQSQSASETKNLNSYMGYAIAATVISVIVLLLILGLRSRLRLVVQLFKEAGRAITDMPSLLILPWLTFICVGIAIVVWFFLALLIESSGMLTSENNVNFNYKKDGAMMVTRWYNLLAMFWVTQFFIACQHMVVAGAVAFWYFSRRKSALNSPVAKSMSRTVRYHLGSVVFGSLLVAIVQFARVILQSVYNTLKTGEDSTIKTNLAKVCGCCLALFEKFLSYINRNAYIEIALKSTNFLESSKRAISVIGSNALRVAAINSVGDFVLFLGKIAVVLSTMLVGIAMIQNKEGVQHVWVPITLASIFAYLVAHSFMTIYEMAIDTIFICFCEDCEMNDGVAKPYFMSRALMELPLGDKIMPM
ncbi:choline transporter-like protein 1 isoform X2 [Neocloeon triangulifer]|uniref:choline transporter-like protein 1 isoform X2 n=1 Tax=Neocloeon triangulifer TaxID=2078957 RepID=UPI00286F67A4|nr:choline transporter-like protein 1 isoform X2 [Neocloeon triangulifer]